MIQGTLIFGVIKFTMLTLDPNWESGQYGSNELPWPRRSVPFECSCLMYVCPSQAQKDGTNDANYGTFTTEDADYSKTYDCFSNAGVSRLKCSRKT